MQTRIHGVDGWWQETTARYDYKNDAHHCPICGGRGIVWAGIFYCDGPCHAIAIVTDGRTFLPAAQPMRES
jgi:hypothetical protein